MRAATPRPLASLQGARGASLAAALLLGFAAPLAAQPDARPPELPPAGAALGARVDLRFQDIRALPRALADFGPQRAFALVFVTHRCPIAARYLPEVERLAAALGPRGAQFVLVDEEPAASLVDVAAFALERDLRVPIVKDPAGRCARALGVGTTPEVVVLDAEQRLRYRGRIDDRLRLGGGRERATRADLRLALEDVLAGRPVEVAETPVDGCRLTAPPVVAADAQLTFTRDVAPIVFRHCLECHRTGGSAPFPLATYQDLWTIGDMVAEVVRDRRMPPWYATAGPEQFSNHRGLSDAERATILAWVAAGAPEGDPADLPPAPSFPTSRWSIGAPDRVLEMPRPIAVPADGYLPYQYVMLPARFEHDTWVERIELVAEHPEVMHHCNLFFLRPGKPFDSSQILSGKVPGGAPLALDPGVAVFIPKGALLGLQIHYQPNGRAVDDRVSVGLVYPRTQVEHRMRAQLIEDKAFRIPAGDPHHRVAASYTFPADAIAGGVFGHMHLRGKDVTFTATLPDGASERLLEVPSYSFDWQMAYAFRAPRRFPRGTRIDVVAHFDNSRFNPYNPDPAATVGYGLQTDKEMMHRFVYYVLADERLAVRVDPSTGAPLE